MSHCKPCTLNYSKGGGTGVAEALGNWGFSNEVASPGHELSRMQCLLERMEALHEQPKCSLTSSRKKDCTYDSSSKSKCKQNTENGLPKKSPLITYCSVSEKLPTSDKYMARNDARYPVFGRSYFVQRSDKWYKLGPLCCPQPCCPAPYCCPKPEKIYCYTGCCS